MTDVTETVHRVAGCAVSMKRAGQGAPLLFLHGGNRGLMCVVSMKG